MTTQGRKALLLSSHLLPAVGRMKLSDDDDDYSYDNHSCLPGIFSVHNPPFYAVQALDDLLSVVPPPPSFLSQQHHSWWGGVVGGRSALWAGLAAAAEINYYGKTVLTKTCHLLAHLLILEYYYCRVLLLEYY